MDSGSGQKILVFSGAIAAGKSSIVRELIERYRFRKLSSGTHLEKLAKENGWDSTRLGLVRLGDQLDADTCYFWVVTDVAVPTMTQSPLQRRWLFDSARKRRQVEHFRKRFTNHMFHIHVHAAENILRSRFISRDKQSDDNISYDAAVNTNNEREARSLGDIANLVVDTSCAGAGRIADEVMEGFLKWSRLF